MYELEMNTGRGRDNDRFLSPSFSSTLLDQIFRSIDDGDSKTGETKFYTETTTTTVNKKKQTTDTKTSHQSDHDQDDVLFFSSTSISSDSSCGGFSSSDTDSVSLSRASSYLAPPRPKPVESSTSASFRLEKQGTTRVFDGFCPAKQGTTEKEAVLAVHNKNKSRALKIYNNLKKVKQPISPGGRLTSFLNSLFAQTGNEDGNKKHKKKKSTKGGTCKEEHVINAERKVAKSGGASSFTCSSASSFSRSCLSKTSKTTSSLCNVVGNNRTVRFCPVEEKELIKSRVAGEAAAREFLKEYRHNQKKSDFVLKDLPIRTKTNHNHEDDHDDDDAASDASSDLFELDNLDVSGCSRYCEELPVYETTHVSTNRAIAKGLISIV